MEVIKDSTCNTKFIVESCHACPRPTGLGAKGLLILGLSLLTLYLVVGALVLHFHYKRDVGPDLVLHREFWTEIPALARDGCSFSGEFFSVARQDGIRSAYEQVLKGGSSGLEKGGSGGSGGSGSGGGEYGSGAQYA